GLPRVSRANSFRPARRESHMTKLSMAIALACGLLAAGCGNSTPPPVEASTVAAGAPGPTSPGAPAPAAAATPPPPQSSPATASPAAVATMSPTSSVIPTWTPAPTPRPTPHPALTIFIKQGASGNVSNHSYVAVEPGKLVDLQVNLRTKDLDRSRCDL